MNQNIAYTDIFEILRILCLKMDQKTLMTVFNLGDQKAAAFFQWAKEHHLLPIKNRPDFQNSSDVCVRDISMLIKILSIPMFKFLTLKKTKEIEICLEKSIGQLILNKASKEDIIQLVSQVGDLFLQARCMDSAVILYRQGVYYCKKFNSPKNIFIASVLNLSRIDFMRGANPIETATLQMEGLSHVTKQNFTVDDALLMLYAGIVQHFMGNEEKGHCLRQKGEAYIRERNHQNSEAVPLIGWHIYLKGHFKEAIEYYEDMILAIENRQNAEIATLAYPPIIYSYMFLGEFQRAMILNEIIYSHALEYSDFSTAALMHGIEGRIHVSANDNENGADILYKALAESSQGNFVWGQYYALCGLCKLHLNRGQIKACRDNLILMRKLAKKYHIGKMYSSPFMLDVLKHIEMQGLSQIKEMGYENEIMRHIRSHNIHMKGTSFRHLALLEKSRKGNPDEILEMLTKSIDLLKESGNLPELGASYIEFARIMSEINNIPGAKKYASLGWKTLGSCAREHFPNELAGLVEVSGLNPDMGTYMDTLLLELHHMVDVNSLILKMLTQLGRILKVESSGFALFYNNSPSIIATQNINTRQESSPQYQRMLGWISFTQIQKKTTVQFNDCPKKTSLFVDFDDDPGFILCVPFFEANQVKAVLYLESYYRGQPLTLPEKQGLEKFARNITPHMFGVLLNLENKKIPLSALDKKDAKEIKKSGDKDYFIGISDSVRFALHRISLVARTEVPVLLFGETGVGKEVFSKEIYCQSNRKGSFIKVNCGAIPDTLIESELFGYERGSFTGANQMRKGYFELADKGTIFLDEIGELSLRAQVKLLRVLQEKEIMRIGGSEMIPVDFRLIAATNKDLALEVEEKRFRNDLYFRLNVLPIEIPPLRKRKSDIPEFVQFFMEKYCKVMEKPLCAWTPEVLARLMAHDWPGNVRELENVIQRLVLLSETNEFTLKNIEINDQMNFVRPDSIQTLEEVTRKHIIHVIRHCNGKIAGTDGAARLLGLKRTTLISRMEKLGIKSNS